jgi:hypothetical protein
MCWTLSIIWDMWNVQANLFFSHLQVICYYIDIQFYCMSQDSSAGIMTGYGLDNQIRVQFLVGAGNFSLQHHVQTGSGAHPTPPPIQWVLGVKWLWHEAGHSPPSSGEVKSTWSYICTPHYIFMTWCLVKYKDNFTFYLTFIVSLFLFLRLVATVGTKPRTSQIPNSQTLVACWLAYKLSLPLPLILKKKVCIMTTSHMKTGAETNSVYCI